MKIRLSITILLIFIFTFKINSQTISRIESLQSLYLELFNDSILIGKATGFIIKSKTQYYLITNWHVATNKNPVTNSWINPQLPISPTKIGIVHNGKILGTYSPRFESLISSKGQINFKEFVIGKEKVDVVALPLKDTIGNISFYPVNYSKDTDTLLLRPTDRLFVLGFPHGFTSTFFFPIWKSGLIASEPDIDQENKPIIWLDIPSYGGMSGSPVYLIEDRLTFKNGGWIDQMGTKESYFMGVFSHGNDINIGALWKGNYLKKIFEALP